MAGEKHTFWDDPVCLSLLESILPYVKYAAGHNLPNAAVYVDLIDRMIWRDEGASADADPAAHEPSQSALSRPSGEHPLRSSEYQRGYSAGCAWYAAYIQQVAELRNNSRRCQVCGNPSTSDLCSFECYADFGGLPK